MISTSISFDIYPIITNDLSPKNSNYINISQFYESIPKSPSACGHSDSMTLPASEHNADTPGVLAGHPALGSYLTDAQ